MFGSILRGSGQVIFMESPWSGLLNFAAMFWAAYAGGTTLAVAIGSVVGTVVATLVASRLQAGRTAIKAGLYGFNGMLIGAGIPTFLEHTLFMWEILIFVCGISAIVTLALGNALRRWSIPGLTFPFILCTWLVLLAAGNIPTLHAIGPSAAIWPGGPDAMFGTHAFVRAVLTSISQIYFVDNPVSGGIFLLAIAIHSPRCAGFAFLGAALAVVLSLWFGADRGMVYHGLWGYSAILTAAAIGAVFIAPGTRALVYALAATVFSVLVHAALSTLFQPAGIPVFTFPFVVTTWIFLLARAGLAETASGK
ncbi:MAG: urea transporter [Proteobacteria bacterium]|nr:urea transporter [Pseudomonadota bacterium]HQR02759.1 urea transporter [Rhodocyclaceae bacterium]